MADTLDQASFNTIEVERLQRVVRLTIAPERPRLAPVAFRAAFLI